MLCCLMKCFCENLTTVITSRSDSGIITSAMSVRIQLIENIITATPISVVIAVTSSASVWLSDVDTLSTSLVR